MFHQTHMIIERFKKIESEDRVLLLCYYATLLLCYSASESSELKVVAN